MTMKPVAFLTLCSALAGCGDGGGGAVDAATGPDAFATDPLIAARPYSSNIPASYDPLVPTPLVIALHHYGGVAEASSTGLLDASARHGFLLAYPSGTIDQENYRFWNATDGCCNRFGATVDDVTYLTAVLDDMAGRYNVDPRRVFFFGVSNGGFMTHRMACELGNRIAAGVSVAGMTWLDSERCAAAHTVNLLQIHGDADAIVPYGGGTFMGLPAFPSVAQTVATWADKNGCTGMLAGDAVHDLDGALAGDETIARSTSGCPEGGAVDLWTIRGGGHIPNYSVTFAEQIWTWMQAHPKP